MVPVLSPEIELLLACSRKQLRPADVERVHRSLRAGIDEERLVSYASAHGLVPLLHRHASERRLTLPSGLLAPLAARAEQITRRGLRLTAELLWLLDSCDHAGIRALPLKGPVLADQVYGSVGLRQFGDLDVLFHARDLPAVSRLLADRGYDVQASVIPVSELDAANEHQLHARSRARRILIELHYSFITPRDGRRQTLDDLEDRLERRGFMGRTVLALQTADQLAYLCDHGAAHSWSRIEWLATAAEVMQSPSVDWTALRRRAEPAGQWHRIRAAAWLARDLLQLPLADAPVGERPRFARRIVETRLRREPDRDLATAWETFLYALATDSGMRPRLKRTWMTFFVASPYDIVNLPGGLAWGWFSRPVSLVSRWRRSAGTRPLRARRGP